MKIQKPFSFWNYPEIVQRIESFQFIKILTLELFDCNDLTFEFSGNVRNPRDVNSPERAFSDLSAYFRYI